MPKNKRLIVLTDSSTALRVPMTRVTNFPLEERTMLQV